MRPVPDPIAPGQESVWDYPRPPRLDETTKHVRVEFFGVVIAETRRPIRILETSHPPTYYLPPEDCKMEYFQPTSGNSFCEFKGGASYYDIRVGDKVAMRAAWYYPNPNIEYAKLRNYIAIYASRVHACYVNGEKVRPQPGEFYGGWITDDIVGPFKGVDGSNGW
jgi:uncharacterized protein (DUF427 family)